MTNSQQAALEQVARALRHELTQQDRDWDCCLSNEQASVALIVKALADQRAKVLEEFRVFLAAVPCVCEHSNIHGSQEFDRHHESWCPKLKADRKLASLTEAQIKEIPS